jgi:glyoxylase-like metal-dependent hydrolase (beta-lactamase superfamily II)
MLVHVEGAIGVAQVGRVFDSRILGFTAQGWLPDFDREALEPHLHWLCPDHYDPESGRIPMPVHSWVIRTERHTVVVDTCVGNDKVRPGLHELHRLNTRYLERMAALGVNREDVDYVLCTHLHCDHVGWNTRLENGRWAPTFPNARYVFSKVECEAASREAADDRTPDYVRNTFNDSVLPVMEAGKALLVEGVHELSDGIILRPAPGHSPGHVRIELRSAGALGVFVGDMLHSPIQVPFWQWSSIACWDRALAAKSRRELLEFCVAENALLLPGHFNAPHVARISERAGVFLVDFGW